MNKEMIVSSNGHETMVAILEDDLVAEVFVERERQRGVVGNVYKGRVNKVLPGMQSSFIDLGLERDGFLYVDDVLDASQFEKLDEDEGENQKATPARLVRVERRAESRGDDSTDSESAPGLDVAQPRPERVERRAESRG